MRSPTDVNFSRQIHRKLHFPRLRLALVCSSRFVRLNASIRFHYFHFRPDNRERMPREKYSKHAISRLWIFILDLNLLGVWIFILEGFLNSSVDYQMMQVAQSRTAFASDAVTGVYKSSSILYFVLCECSKVTCSFTEFYTLNSVISHLWQTKVHVILRSFAVLTWMDEWYYRISVTCDTMESEFVLLSVGVVHSTWLPWAMWHMQAPTFTSGRRRRGRIRRWRSTYWHMAQCEGVGWLLSWFALMTKTCDIGERNVTIRSEFWTTNIRSLWFQDTREWVILWRFILRI